MFSRIIKEFFLKKTINRENSGYQMPDTGDKIKSIGIVVDATAFNEVDKLVDEIKNQNRDLRRFQVLVYDENGAKNVMSGYTSYSFKDIGLNGKIKSGEIIDFVNYPFDLLINYFEVDRKPLLFVAKQSKAKFKVGFRNVRNDFNQFMLAIDKKEYTGFVGELFKYLKILNKV